MSENQPVIWMHEIVTVCEPKQISSGLLAQVDRFLNLPPSCSPGSSSPMHWPSTSRQSKTSSGNKVPQSVPSSVFQPSSLSSACLPLCLPCFDSRRRTVHSHAQHCSSINKGFPPPPSSDLRLRERNKIKMKTSELLWICVSQCFISLSFLLNCFWSLLLHMGSVDQYLWACSGRRLTLADCWSVHAWRALRRSTIHPDAWRKWSKVD